MYANGIQIQSMSGFFGSSKYYWNFMGFRKTYGSFGFFTMNFSTKVHTYYVIVNVLEYLVICIPCVQVYNQNYSISNTFAKSNQNFAKHFEYITEFQIPIIKIPIIEIPGVKVQKLCSVYNKNNVI